MIDRTHTLGRLKAFRSRILPRCSLVGLALSLATGPLHAQIASPGDNVAVPVLTSTGTYSPFEQLAIKEALEALHATIDPEPEGKTIEGIVIVPLEVIQARVTNEIGATIGSAVQALNDRTDSEPATRPFAPDAWHEIPLEPPEEARTRQANAMGASVASAVYALNGLHTTTRPFVIEREILLRVGDRWDEAIVEETARSLRRIPQLSLAIVVPLKGSTPDKVRLLAITQDVWSLRFSSNFKFGSGGLESLLMQPTESNLGGTQQTVYGRFSMLPESYSLGAGYVVPRLVGKRLTFAGDANIIMNRRSGRAEGSYGSVEIARTLFSTRTEWAWAVSTVWRDEVIRRYVNARLSTFNAKVTPQNDRIPYEYRGQRITETASVTRSFGIRTKNDFSGGIELNSRNYHTGDLAFYDPAAVKEFVTTVAPVSDRRAGPFVQYHGYSTRFLRVLDFETLGRQEDYRLGHELYLRVYPVTSLVGSSRDFVGVYAAGVYTIPIGADGLVRAAIDTSTELETTRISDASISGSARLVTPRILFGRFVLDGVALSRYRNYLNRLTFLGGDTRLRGYPSAFFIGKDVVAANAEFRTRPFEILSAQLGAAVFYDVGNAFNGFDHMTVHHAAGFGARLLIPQLDKVVLRGDVGFPLPIGGGYPAGVAPVSFFIAFDQAFGLPGATGGPGTGVLGQ